MLCGRYAYTACGGSISAFAAELRLRFPTFNAPLLAGVLIKRTTKSESPTITLQMHQVDLVQRLGALLSLLFTKT